jgi:hypothetical protein
LPHGWWPQPVGYFAAAVPELIAMPSETETLALHLVRALYDATGGQSLHWRMSAEIDRETADAIEFAVEIRAAVGPLRLAAHATKIEALSTFGPGRQRRPAARRGAKIRSGAG